ncbi:MAG: NAD(P)H-binding protein [Anditalea sp.]
MDKILIVGAAGSLGFEVVKKLAQSNIPFRALASNPDSAEKLKPFTSDIWIADARNPDAVKGLCEGISIVFSSLGKSVSLFTVDEGNYDDIDYESNKNIIAESCNAEVKRFVYCSIKGSDSATKLKLAEVHKKVQQLMAKAFENYTIIKPTGFFSGLNDLLIIAKRGLLLLPGSGNYRTNSIHQQDLAQVVMDHLHTGPKKMDVGGPEVHTRDEMAKIVQQKTNSRFIHVPEWMLRTGIPIIGIFNKSIAHNLDYFRHVSTTNMVAPKYGSITFREYVDAIDLNDLP